jgi:predicted PurR-regulated permease PerM
MNRRPHQAVDAPAPLQPVVQGAQIAHPAAFWTGATRVAIFGIFLLSLLAALSFARPILLPIALALVFGIVLSPILNWAGQHRVPHWLSGLVLVLGIFAALSYAVVLLSNPAQEWIARAPEFGAILRERMQILDRPIAAFNSLRESIAGPAASNAAPAAFDIYSGFLQPALGMLTPAAGQLMVFFATLFFFLAGRENLHKQLLAYLGDRGTRLEALHILSDIETSLASYIAIVTVINAVVGCLVAGVAYLVGLPNPVIWGVLAFFVNFVPYLGPAFLALILFVVGLVHFNSLGQALLGPALYVALNTLEGQFVTPSIVGLRLALSPLLVFLSVAFWAWFWGPFGALLAVPLLIIATIALHHLLPKDVVKLPG